MNDNSPSDLSPQAQPAPGTAPPLAGSMTPRLPQSVVKIPWMQPNEVAPAVVFLATDVANRVTGSTYDAAAGDGAKYTA